MPLHTHVIRRMLPVFTVVACAALIFGCGGPAASPGTSSATSPSPLPTAVVQSSDPSAQKIFVDPSDGYWNPDVLHAKANTSIEMTFGKGTYECANGLTFDAFGVTTAVDLRHGPVTLRSKGLPPGTYPWLCSMQGMCGGKLIVQ